MFEVYTRSINMTVSDLYINSNDAQTFILFEEGGTKPCYGISQRGTQRKEC